MIPVETRDKELTQLFLKYGANTDLKNRHGISAFDDSMYIEFQEIVSMMLDAKTEIDAAERLNFTRCEWRKGQCSPRCSSCS